MYCTENNATAFSAQLSSSREPATATCTSTLTISPKCNRYRPGEAELNVIESLYRGIYYTFQSFPPPP